MIFQEKKLAILNKVDVNKTKISVWSNNPLLEKLFHGHNLHLQVDFVHFSDEQETSYVMALVDIAGDLSDVSQKIISIYDNCREKKQKLTVVLLHPEKIDTEKNIYFTTLLESLSGDKPLYRLVIAKDLYQTSLIDPITTFDSFLISILATRKINITSKGEGEYYPLSVHDFIAGILKVFFLANTAGKTFWLIGEPISDLDLSYLIKKKLENVDDQEFEINADNPNITPSVHIRSLGNQTAAALNWEPTDDFYEAMTDITRRLSEDQLALSNSLNQRKRNAFDQLKFNIYSNLAHLQKKYLSKKIKISDGKQQFIYLHNLIEAVTFFVVFSYFCVTITFFAFSALSLTESEKSISLLRKGDFVNSVNALNKSKTFLEIGESSYSLLSPILSHLPGDLDSKNRNMFAFGNYLNLSLNNIQQTYSFADKIYKGFSGSNTNLKYDDISLALKSNLSQIYENLNQIEILAQPGRLPQILETKIKSSSEFKNIKTVEQQVVNVMKSADLIPPALAGDTARNIVVLFQNNQELRSSGGRIDYVLVLAVDQGKIVSSKIYSSAEIDSLVTESIQPPPMLKQLFDSMSWKFKDLNYNPDFPQTATNISWYLEKTLRFRPNVLIALNNHFLADLLDQENNLTIGGETITSERINSSDGLTPTLYKELISLYVDKITQGKLPLLTVGRVLSKEIAENQILYWSSDTNAQANITDQAYSGSIIDYPCHSALFNISNCIAQTTNLNETSISLYENPNKYDRQTIHKIWLENENVRHEYLLNYKLTAGEAKKDTQNVKIYQLYVTSPSVLTDISVDGQAVATPGVIKETDNKLDRYQIPLVFNEDKEREISIRFSTPIPPITTYPVGYSLTEYRQPGLGSQGALLEINYSATAKPSTITAPVTLAPNKFTYIFPTKTSTFGVSFVPNQP